MYEWYFVVMRLILLNTLLLQQIRISSIRESVYEKKSSFPILSRIPDSFASHIESGLVA